MLIKHHSAVTRTMLIKHHSAVISYATSTTFTTPHTPQLFKGGKYLLGKKFLFKWGKYLLGKKLYFKN